MFESILHPTRRSLRDLLVPAVFAITLLFCAGALWAFASSGGSAAAAATTTPPGEIQCTTADGTVVLIGEIVAAADQR